jgi:Tol biopolymer transport system component
MRTIRSVSSALLLVSHGLACLPLSKGIGNDAGPSDPACEVASITSQGVSNGWFFSPDGTQYVLNKQDDAGVYQIYVAETGSSDATCISCAPASGAPSPNVHKLMPVWHPSGEWLMVGAEMPNPNWGLVGLCASCELGLLVSGVNLQMYAVKPDGSQWFQVVPGSSWPAMSPPFAGYTGPAFTPDGKHAYWARIVNGDVLQYTFGQWTLMRTDYVVENGVPSMQNPTDVTPMGANWVEPGNFSPDGETLLLSSDIGLCPTCANGQDQWTYNVSTGALANLTNSPEAWDEHGLFSPNGKKIVWMSSQPYPGNNQATDLKTEFMLMDADGSNVTQLTHFNVPGYPESTTDGTVAAVAVWSRDGSRLYGTLLENAFLQSEWVISFSGRCGG